MTDQTSNTQQQVLLFMDTDKCKVVRANDQVTIVWITRDMAHNLATHIYAHLDEFPEVLPAG